MNTNNEMAESDHAHMHEILGAGGSIAKLLREGQRIIKEREHAASDAAFCVGMLASSARQG